MWSRLHYVYPYPHVDDIIPLMADGKLLAVSGHPVPARQPAHPQADEASGCGRQDPGTHPALARHRAGHHHPQHVHRRLPGETDAEFEELLDFLDEAQLDRVGAFAYSPVEGAAANALPDPVPEEVKQERLARFMERQAAISEAKLADKIGSVQRCLVDAIDGDLAIARSMADAPEIDGLVQIQNGFEAGLKPGEFVDVEIMGSDEHDLYGEVVFED